MAMLAVVFSLLWIVPQFVRADNGNLDKVINVSAAGEYSVAFPKEAYQGESCTLTITNTSAVPMQLTISAHTNRTMMSASGDEFTELNYPHNTPYDKDVTRFFAPGQNLQLALTFAGDYGNGASRTTSFTVTAQQTAIRDQGGKSFSAPQPLTLDASFSSYLLYYNANPAQNARYFSISVPNKRYLKLDFTCSKQTSEVNLYKAEDTAQTTKLLFVYAKDRSVSDTVLLEPGTYILKLACNINGDPAIYTLTLGGRDYISATGVSITCTDKSLTAVKTDNLAFHFTASTIPANSDDKLKTATCNGEEIYGEKDASGNTMSITLEHPVIGYNNIQVSTTTGVLSKVISAVVQPQKPKFSKPVTTYYNKIVFEGVDTQYQGTAVRMYMKSGKKWVLKKTQTTKGLPAYFNVTKLKANTKYTFKFVSITKDSNGKIVESAPLIKSFKTARKDKPSVSSVRASKVSVSSYYKWVKESGHHIYKKFYTTHYTLTVSLNKKIPGSRGIRIATSNCQPANIKGKGTRFVVSFNVDGYHKGEKIKVYMNSWSQGGTLGGYGPEVRKQVTLN